MTDSEMDAEMLNNATKSYKFSREERKGHVILFKSVKNSNPIS